MGKALVVSGATLKCDKSETGSSVPYMVPPMNMTKGDGAEAATEMEFVPMAMIPSWGMCSKTNSANPMVASLTAAALGTPTPAPCIPVIVAPWSGASGTVKIKSKAALHKGSTCKCMWTGTISIDDPGTTDIKIGE